jgi:TnpA family transposase
MPRRERLSRVQRAALIGIPTDRDGLVRYYTLSAADRGLIAAKRGDRNRLGFAMQLAYLRHPGQALRPGHRRRIASGL